MIEDVNKLLEGVAEFIGKMRNEKLELERELADARAEIAALVAEFQRMADEPPTLEDIAADLDKIEMLQRAIKCGVERLKKGWGRLDEWQVTEIVIELEAALSAAERGGK